MYSFTTAECHANVLLDYAYVALVGSGALAILFIAFCFGLYILFGETAEDDK